MTLNWPDLPDVAVAAILGATVTAAGGLYWNFRSAKSNRKLPFLQKQMDLCFEASQIVSVLATTDDQAKWYEARGRFWQLYYGVLAIVENPEVERCMIECGKFIPVAGAPPTLPDDNLWHASLNLGKAIRTLVLKAWEVNFRELEPTIDGREGVLETFRRTYREEMQKRVAKD